jgi:hypothetical protein
MGKLSEYLNEHRSRRDPPYRPLAVIDDAERERLDEKIGGVANYGSNALQRMVLADPDNKEYKRALTSSIVSAEYAGIDAFGSRVAHYEDEDIPEYLLMAMVRQTWDEVRHARLGTELLELEYDGTLGEYPDTLAGSANARRDDLTEEQRSIMKRANMDPVSGLSRTNVGVEGRALLLFSGVSRLGAKIGDRAMEQAYDYNWADEVLHVAIGDYFLKKIAEQRPETEATALKVQAQTELNRAEGQRSGGEDVINEVKAFLEEEADVAASVLAGPLSDGAKPGEDGY